MATDAHDSRRKHHRSSSPEDVERSSKRHKHRHHSHRHRHGSKKREEEIEYDGGTFAAVPSPTPTPNPGPHSRLPDDDVEEGEILDDVALDGEVGKRMTESDVEPGEIEVTGDRYVRSDKKNPGLLTKNSKTRSEDISNDKFISPALDAEEGTWRQSHLGHEVHEDDGSPNHLSAETQDGMDARASTDGVDNGYLARKSSKGDKRQNGELGHFKGNEKLKGDYHYEAPEANGMKVNCHRNSSSESGGEKYRMSGSSPSHDRHRSRSRSTGHTRDRSRSRGIVEEYVHSKRRQAGEKGSHYYTGRHKTDYDLDEERGRARGRERDHGSIDLVVDDRREHSTRYHSREARDRDRSRDGDVDRDLHREKKREETSRNREVDWVGIREKEHRRSHERYRRDGEKDRSREREEDRDRDRRREKERDRSWETAFEREHRREKERGRSRDRTRGSERDRDWESERDDKNRERDNIKERERRDDRYRHKDRDTANDKDKHLHHDDGYDNGDRYRKHSRHDETEYHRQRKRNSDPVKFYNSMGSTIQEDERKLKSGEVEQDDIDEDTMQLPEQEEEDLNRIKEESRRRREAIMEKYKKQHQQVEQVVENEAKNKDADIPADISEALDDKNEDVDDAEPSFAVGKSPENVNVTSGEISGAGGLGEGTPKSERSDDKFCDDIFGETPTGVRKSGKGDGLLIERVSLHDNWDDAEGYYSYRFGEILDGRYEVTSAHGRGVFSTVVRAKNLKAGNGEPEVVAIKIIRNNDTMYKAGLDELVILKKLVGADPDDKRHCVRFLSSFKYRNHLCLVFESLNMNLREVLKKFGRNIGLRLTAVRAYAKQLFIALKHLRNCGVLHCDIKPDNMLVNEAKNVLKLCDFGNAMFAGKNEVTPYLVSRFYRAPEISCCLYEFYTGKVLFPGLTNNDMLRLHMELKGPFPKKMLRKGAFTEQHFDQDLIFLATEEDPVTKKTIKRMILNIRPKDIGTIITGSPGEDLKMLANFKDLLEKIFVLDPDKRLTVSQALNHPFITGK
ncbi:uncharacterized protein LOC133316887 [Gastrolobium bilobum]|uniref:uncharacterized protein LOC133316887 n=1 Tax=Gastrolobium bilobum TaxID=150636 RepID=UPI002AB2A3DD|nr:uncharacterized protein LOC133316887 [Gastrolobium bilobum]